MNFESEGLTAEQLARLEAVPSEPGEFGLVRLLGAWKQWVLEVERGENHVPEELESLYATRDDLDSALVRTSPDDRLLVFPIVDAFDRRFRDATVANAGSTVPANDPWSWWHGRVPIGNAARLYLYGRLDQQTPS